MHDAAGLRSVRVATYQSVSGTGARRMQQLLDEAPADHDLSMDWEFDGEEFDEEAKIREETRKILELPELAVQATCVRVPVPVGHAESVWVETEQPLSPGEARELLAARRRCASTSAPLPARRRAATRRSWAASAATRRPRTAWRYTSPATTSARGPP